MRILITGATGMVGRALCLRLRRDGHQLTAWVRDEERARQILGAEVLLVSAASGPDALERAVTGNEAVINLAGENIAEGRWTARRKEALRSSRLDLTRRVVNAMGGLDAGPKLLINASAIGYYGDRGAEPLDENAPAGEGFVARLCEEWEQEAQAAREHGVRVVRLRIGVVLSRDGGMLAKVLPIFRAGFGGKLGSGRQFFPWIHLDDLLEIIVRALEDEALEGPINAVAPKPVINAELTRALGRALRRPTIMGVPKPMLKLALGEMAQTLLASCRTVPQRLLDAGFAFSFADLDAALDDLLASDGSVDIRPLDDDEHPRSDYLDKRRPRYLLRQQTVIDAPLDEVFSFFSRAENLGALTPSTLSFAIVSPMPLTMKEGTRIDYRLRLGALPMRWRTVIESWLPRERFVDAQHRGPYRAWWHEHRFRAQGARTVMEDRVYYAPPFGLLGRMAHRLFIAPMLRLIFGYRERAIAYRFGRPLLGA